MSDTVGRASRLPVDLPDPGRPDACPTRRWSIYSLFIVITVALVTARVMSMRASNPRSPTPFQSANDRSRWATIRALVEEGTYSIDNVIFDQQGQQIFGWYTIDLVRHRGSDSREHYYSSKPTLLPTLLAGEYWLVKQIAGATLAEQPGYIARVMLLATNVLPLIAMLVVLARLIDDLGRTDWARLFGFACACFATFVTTFSVTLNNHSLAAITTACGLAATIPVWRGDGRWWHLALAGLLLSLTAANELPALSLLALVAAGLAWKAPLKTAFAFLPAAAMIAAAAIGTNVYAHSDWRTPYAHRQDGPAIAAVEDALAAPLDDRQVAEPLRQALNEHGYQLSDKLQVHVRRRGDRWELFDEQQHLRFALQRAPEGGPARGIEVREWDNWYDYPGTHWDPATIDGIDRGEASPLVYAFHCLVGHHGLFSLTPIWLFSVAGCFLWIRDSGERTKRALAVTTVLITLVVLAFYLSRPQLDRNYGGGTCCLRWMIWLTPLWLLTLLPAVDRLSQSRWGRGLALALLASSAFSAWYAADNPWSDPWIYDYWEQLGWIKY